MNNQPFQINDYKFELISNLENKQIFDQIKILYINSLRKDMCFFFQNKQKIIKKN